MSAESGRAAVGLGIGAVASVLLGVADRTPWRLVTFGVGGVVVLVALGALAVAGGWLRSRAVVLVAGCGFLAGAVLQVVQSTAGGRNALGGDGSTVGLLLAFALGLLAVGSVAPPADRELTEEDHGS